MKNLLTEKLRVINVGLEMFYMDLKRQKVDVIQVDWRPPAGGDVEIMKLLETLEKVDRNKKL